MMRTWVHTHTGDTHANLSWLLENLSCLIRKSACDRRTKRARYEMNKEKVEDWTFMKDVVGWVKRIIRQHFLSKGLRLHNAGLFTIFLIGNKNTWEWETILFPQSAIVSTERESDSKRIFVLRGRIWSRLTRTNVSLGKHLGCIFIQIIQQRIVAP
jgi:hypothetical protein